MTRKLPRITLVSLIASAVLSACGGGGGGSSGGVVSPPVVVPPVPVTPVDTNPLQTSVAAPLYAAGTLELAAFTALNQARSTYGVGQLAQNAPLDLAASNHAAYIQGRVNAGDFNAVGHTEDATQSGFTGVTSADRIAYAKYAASATGEDLASFVQVKGVSSVPGAVAVDSLLSAPYHRFSLFDSFKDVGIKEASLALADQTGLYHVPVINLGLASGAASQLPAADWIGVWPADKAANVMYGFAGESPNPIPVNNGACAGYPVSLQVRGGQVLTTNMFTLVETAGSAPVSVQLSTAASDVNPSMARANTAYVIPYKPLKLATQYTAHFVGSHNGVTIDKTWSFTTTGSNTKNIYGCDPS